MNLYTYCANEPVLHVDPSGHEKKRNTTSFEKKEIKSHKKNGPKYRPNKWNDAKRAIPRFLDCYICGEKNVLAPTSVQRTTNCYAYAFNYKKSPNMKLHVFSYSCKGEMCCSKFGMQPGDYTGVDYTFESNRTAEEYLEAVKNDMRVLNVKFQEITKKK